jgi:DHA2 family multidrug resistance protein-like MFS transporter
MPSTLSIIRNVFTDAGERSAAIGIWSGASAAGFALGPVVGGVLLAHFWWGSVFLINLPLCALIVVAGVVLLPESRNPRPGPLDLISAVLSVVGVIATIFAITEGFRGGALPRVAVGAVLGIGALALFGLRQARLAEPLIDLRLFRRPEFAVSTGCALVAMFATAALTFVFSQYFQLVLGWSPLTAGLAGLPGPIAAVIGGLAAAPLVPVWGRGRVLGTGLGLLAVGSLLYAQVGITVDYALLLVPMSLFGVGAGLTVTVASDTVVATVPAQRAGSAAAISETAFELGGALGIAVIGSVLSGVYRAHVAVPAGVPGPAAALVRESIGSALHAVLSLPSTSASTVIATARQAFVNGIAVAALGCAGLAAAFAVIVLLSLRRVPEPVSDRDEIGGPSRVTR